MLRVIVLVASLAPLLIALTRPQQASRPRALAAFEEARREILSGRIEWVRRTADDRDSMRFVSRYAANGDRILEYRGDDEGWTRKDRQTGRGLSRFPMLYMQNEEGFWSAAETTNTASLVPRERTAPMIGALKDIRYVGAFATTASMEPEAGFALIWAPDVHPITQWEEHQVDGKWLVKGTSPSGAVKTWLIDPDKGWNAERVTFEVGSTKVEAVASLRRFGDVWLPERTVFLENGRIAETIEVTSAACNRPGDRPSFNLSDLGMEVGTQVSDGREGTGARYWTGAELISSPQWHADVKAGKREYGPTIKRILAGQYTSPYLTEHDRTGRALAEAEIRIRFESTRHEGLWEAYVRQFIAKYELSDEQAQQAFRILRSCQDRAREIVERQGQRSSVISELLDAKRSKQDTRATHLQARLEELNAPVAALFEQQLKPRLEKIPTRAQRAAAEQKAAQQQPGDQKAAAGQPPPAKRP